MKLLLLFFALISVVYSDYFDILKEEFEQTPTGRVRRFFITAEEEIWDYASQSQITVPDIHVLGTRYYKALYHEYEDESYTKKKKRPYWQGNMGPILRVEVGDVIQVFFWNKASRNFTIHPHGIFYEFEMEGAIFKGSFDDSIVKPNHNYTYTWNVLPRAGPGPKDGNSIVWGYHSHVTEADLYAGLYGAIVVYRPGTLSNKDIVTSIFVTDENQSPYLHQTKSTLYPDFDSTKYNDKQLYQANQFHTINGLVSSSPKDLVVKVNTTWHLIGWGTYWDMRNIQWQNAQIYWDEEQVDHIRIMPASFQTAIITPNSHKGTYQFGVLKSSKEEMVMNYIAS